MTYELAKQLKDAGFPQKENTYWKNERGEGTLGVYAPTLSELIEACGEEFYSIRKQTLKYCAESVASDDRFFQAKGSTPEEAVANLWLELNKK